MTQQNKLVCFLYSYLAGYASELASRLFSKKEVSYYGNETL